MKNIMHVFVLLFSFFVFYDVSFAEEEGEGEKQLEMEYVEMKPKFTVNLKERNKYMMAKVQLMVEGDKYLEKVEKHLPMLRHELIMLYSGKSIDELQTMEQREQLRVKSRQAIIDALDKYENSDGFRDVFFTEFLVN